MAGPTTAGVQHAAIGLHPLCFNHNALRHLTRSVPLLLMVFAARGLLESAAS